MTDLCVIDWQAVAGFAQAGAALITGLAAVAAAYLVGRRQAAISLEQVRIAARQTDILARQTELAALDLRADLYERRFQVWQATRDYLTELLIRNGDPREEVTLRFYREHGHARFLFSLNGQRIIQEIVHVGFAYESFVRNPVGKQESTEQEDIGKMRDWRTELSALEGRLLNEFQGELSLSSPIAHDAALADQGEPVL